ncbi:putative mitochondrial chaperone BCS1-B [Leucoagaricus sp. SymC.cos]|nr:putative mitochondrial chaperone BCS1-B [Leucoagaricus sp. SymC.cos]
MDALKSLIQPIVGGVGGSSVVDGMKLVVLGGTVETARRVSSSAWSHFVNSFFLTAHFSEEDYPFDWLMLWLSRRPEWQCSREFETTTRTSGPGGSTGFEEWEEEEQEDCQSEFDSEGRPKTRVVFQPTFDTTHTIFYRNHWLRVRRGRKADGCEQLSISVVARSNTILKQLVLQAKREYEAEAVHRIQIYFADSHGAWRWTDSRHKRPMASIVLNPGVKEMLLEDTKDFLRSEKWYADRGIPFRRGYLLHGVPGSGKSSLIHALAGAIQLDIYVVSLSASWISDSTLTTLMGRVPARCVVLLEDLDAAFTRSTSRDDSALDDDKDKEKKDGENGDKSNNQSSSSRRRRDALSDVNTLSLSGLLNALDGVAAAEGRLLFATTNHLERLDPALSRPGRMDVWIEFRNASKWQAEALFRNFFPCAEDEAPIDDSELEGVDVNVEVKERSRSNSSVSSGSRSYLATPSTPSITTSHSETPSSPSLWSIASSFSPFGGAENDREPRARTPSLSSPPPLASSIGSNDATSNRFNGSEQFGASNTAYRPPPPTESVMDSRHSAAPLDKKTLNELAKKFADGIPEEEFSVAALQGYLLKNKSKPEAAANGVIEWVEKERQMRERLKKEKDAREQREKAARERRRRLAAEKDKEERELKKKEAELEKEALEKEAAAAAGTVEVEKKDEGNAGGTPTAKAIGAVDDVSSSFVIVPSTDNVDANSRANLDLTKNSPTVDMTSSASLSTDTPSGKTCVAATSMALTRRHEAGYALISAATMMPFARFPLVQIYILQAYALVLQLATRFT